MITKMNFVLDSIRLGTGDWDNKYIRKVFTEVMNGKTR